MPLHISPYLLRVQMAFVYVDKDRWIYILINILYSLLMNTLVRVDSLFMLSRVMMAGRSFEYKALSWKELNFLKMIIIKVTFCINTLFFLIYTKYICPLDFENFEGWELI